MTDQPLRITLIDDDEDSFVIVRDLLADVQGVRTKLTWHDSYEKGMTAIGMNHTDVFLVDYRLGADTGLDLLREARARKIVTPFILLTGQGDQEIAVEAMKAGATDYLVKGQIDVPLLERSLRHAVETARNRTLVGRFVDIMESTNDLVGSWDTHGLITYLNRAGRRMLGIGEHEDLAAVPVKQFHSPASAELIASIARPAADRDGHWSGETELLARDSHRIPVLQTVIAHKAANGTTEYYSTTCRDITERKQAEEELRFQKTMLESQGEASIDGILVVSPEGKILSFNRRFVELWKIPAAAVDSQSDEACQHSVLDKLVAPKEFLDKVRHLYQHTSEEARDEIALKDGRVFDRYTAPVKSAGGQHYGRVWFFRDISGQKKSEAAIRQSTQQLEAVFKAFPDLFFLIDAKGTILDYRGGQSADLLVPPAQFLRRRVQDFLPADVSRRFNEATELIKSSGQMTAFEYSLPLPQGEQFFEARLVPLDAEHVVVLARNISERKQAEQSQARLATAVEQSAEVIVITDAQAVIQYVNPAFERVTGYSRAESVGQTPRLLKSGRQGPDFYENMWSRLAGGQVWSGQLTNRRKNGSLYEAESTITPVRDQEGKIINFVAVSRDVTYQRSIEEQLRQSQKMQAVGRLAGGIAHDFNNILTVINGYCAMLSSTTAGDGLRSKGLEAIQKSANRASALTRQLLAFSRKQLLNPKVLNMNQVISGMADMLQRLIGENIELCPILAEDISCVKADAGQIEQVIMNMAVNARDAMPLGGKLVIETMMVQLEGMREVQAADFVPSGYVRITISDNGVGMTDEVKAHLFEPFFTTKGRGEGTGLGLATSYGIIKQSGGHILVYSEPGHGTAFKIYLPAVAESVEQKPAATTLAPQNGHETILLVEDEEALRELGIRILHNCGYTVLAACNGREGVELARKNHERIDLIVTDVIMPLMGGKDMVKEIKPILPRAQVMFMSGYTDDALAEHGVLDPGIWFLEKPFTPTRLANKVREVLDHPAC